MEPCRKRHRSYMPFPPSIDLWRNVTLDHSLYPTLVLHLGYSLDDPELLTVLCQHWRFMTSRTSLMDAEVELALVTQILQSIKQKEPQIQLVEHVLQVVSNLLQQQYCCHQTNSTADDELAMALILHVDTHDTVPELLGQLLDTRSSSSSSSSSSPRPRSSSSIIQALYTAACVIWIEAPNDKVDHHLYQLGKSIQQDCATIDPYDDNNINDYCNTYLWALSLSREFAAQMVKSQSILNYLTQEHQSKTLAKLAEYYPSQSITLHLEHILLSAAAANHGDMTKEEEAIQGLSFCSKFIASSSSSSLSSSSRPSSTIIMDAIANAAMKGSKAGSILLCHLVQQNKVSTHKLVHILEANNDKEICEIIMTCMVNQLLLLDDSSKDNNNNNNNTWVLHSVANTVCWDSVSPLMEEHALTLFVAAAKDETQWVHMARTPKLLEALVKLASSSSSSSSQDVVMDILWKLSTPVSNRRILANHTGLLSTWIRFVRNLSQPQHQQQHDMWKDRLFELSDLL